MARILITRPEEDAAAFAEVLAGLGHQVVLEPLLTIKPREGAALNTAGVQALLFTSANGVRAAARLTGDRTVQALCVGDTTARAARDAGFINVASASGDVHALASLATSVCKPTAGALLHVAGTRSAGDLGGSLAAAGFAVNRAVLYEATPAERLSDAARDAVTHRKIDAVALFSPRTARTFARIVRREELADLFADVDMLCLSAAVADALESLPRRRTLVAAEPTQDALIALLS
jgi:uroporphyrinogen-III synthase